MARTTALSIYIDDENKDKLGEIYGEVIESVQKNAISEQIKNKNYSGEPESGSVEISRFANAKVNPLGTARTKGAGEKLKNNGKVTINVDEDMEIVEEVKKKDIKLHGVAGMAEKRKANHAKKMIADLDNKFFEVVEAEGTQVLLTETNIEELVEQLIQSVETTTNDWVDGIERDMLVITAKPNLYGKLRNYIDTIPSTNLDTTENDIDVFHKVRIFSNHRQKHDIICMIDGAAGQLVTTDEYDAEKIPLSNDIAIELFYSRGTKTVMPDLIKYSDLKNDTPTGVSYTNLTNGLTEYPNSNLVKEQYNKYTTIWKKNTPETEEQENSDTTDKTE